MNEISICCSCSNICDFPVCIGCKITCGNITKNEFNFENKTILECDNYSPIEMEGSYHAE